MANDKDFKVKNGVQPTRYVEGLGSIVSSTEGFSIASTSYDSKSFNVTEDANTRNLTFKPDGTKMYVTGMTNDSVYQYALSTAYDVSTASYESKSFSFASQELNPFGIAFNNDGTSMYTVGFSNDTVYQYTLSSAYDVSTASYASKSLDVSSQDTTPVGVTFKPDGTSMYIIGTDVPQSVYQYTLSTAFDVSTGSYASKSLDISSFETNGWGFQFNADGTKCFVAGNYSDKVHQFSLSTAYDVSTASSDGVSFSLATPSANPNGLAFSTDGSKMYVLGTDDYVYQYSTTKGVDTLDLSTGSVFNYSPTASKTLKLSNPAATGTNSGATLLVSGNDTAGIAGNFSTRLWTGTGSDVIVESGVDLTGQGSMVWVKNRSRASTDHTIWTRNDQTGWLKPNTTAAITNQNWVRDWTTTTYTAAGNSTSYASYSGDTYVGWAFKKTANFFDVVTYTGNSTNRTIAHDLGQAPGMIIVKNTSTAGYSWQVYHRSLANTERIELDGTGAKTTGATTYWNSTTATSSVFSIGTHDQVNKTGESYVAYVFGHNTSSGPIQCGSYTGNGQSTGVAQNIGFRPQFMLFKNVSASSGWTIADNVRGEDQIIEANTNGAESTADVVDFTDTGFTPKSNFSNTNTNGHTFIYMAIAAEEGASTTYDSSIKWSGGEAPTSPAIGETDVITLDTTDGGTTYRAAHAIDGAK